MNNPFYRALYETLENGGAVVMASGLEGMWDGKKIIASHAFWTHDRLWAEEEALSGFWQAVRERETLGGVVEVSGCRVLLERLCAREQLIVCGGGHVAMPLAKIGAMLDFDVTVLDDRADFANAERFSDAARVICLPYAQGMEQVLYGENCYFVIVTPGHAADRLCLERVLTVGRFGYIGMIGSKRKTELVMREMERQGYDPAVLAQVHAPIGLAIGGQTPAEIAVSIAAELVSVRAGATGNGQPGRRMPAGCFDRGALERMAAGERMMLATVTEKHGSAPRGVGARLMVDEQGVLYGTTGGGAGEAGVIAAASEILRDGAAKIMRFAMNNDDARRAGMICGGEITVLLERVNG